MTASPSAAAIVAANVYTQLVDALGRLLAFFYSLIPNYGVSIILLTVAVRLLLFPLTAKQVRSMKRMSQLQPEIKRLQAKYRDDRQKMNEELLKFYKENQINPAAGCLPLLLQMPVFFALYRVLRSPVGHLPKTSALWHAFCPESVINAAGKCNAKGLKFMWMDMSVQVREGPEKVTGGHGFTSFGQALPYFILIVLVVLTGMYQGKMMQARQANDNPTPQAAQMQMIAKIMPIFMGFISLGLPAGIVLYFLVGNVWQIGQQAIIANRDVKGPPIKIVDRDDEVVEVEGAAASGAKATLVADAGDATATPAKPAPKPNQRPGARRPAGGGAGAGGGRGAGGGARPARPNTGGPAPSTQTSDAQAVGANAPGTEAGAATAAGPDGDAEPAPAAAPRPVFPWRRPPAAEPSGESNGGGVAGRLFGARGAAKDAQPAKDAGTRGASAKGATPAKGAAAKGAAGKGATAGKGGTAGKGAASSAAANRSNQTSGRVTPKGGAANRSKKRR